VGIGDWGLGIGFILSLVKIFLSRRRPFFGEEDGRHI